MMTAVYQVKSSPLPGRERTQPEMRCNGPGPEDLLAPNKLAVQQMQGFAENSTEFVSTHWRHTISPRQHEFGSWIPAGKPLQIDNNQACRELLPVCLPPGRQSTLHVFIEGGDRSPVCQH